MKKLLLLYVAFLLHALSGAKGQTVIITDDSTYTNGENTAVLDLKSSSRGLLAPRLSNAQKKAIASPTSGLMIYQTDSISGYYIFNNAKWEHLESAVGGVTVTAKTTTTTLAKSETFIVASNNITLTLPAISPADNGLSITIKNVGTYTDLVLVTGYGAATIDGISSANKLTRWQSKNFIAYDGNWVIKNKDLSSRDNILEIAPSSSWTNIDEAVAYLNLHMSAAAMIRFGSGDYPISNTVQINLPYPLTIAGINFGAVKLNAASGLAGKPMFQCFSETYFRMIRFNAATLAGYGNAANEDAIWFNGPDKKYYDVNECAFDGFNKTMLLKNNSELWVFNCSVYNSKAVGVEIAYGTLSGGFFRVAETKFVNNPVGINLLSGISATISIRNGGIYGSNATDYMINYAPATFTNFLSITVMNIFWNGIGNFLNGFDFTRSDGRDANAFINTNVNEVGHDPNAKIDVNANTQTTLLTTAGVWYKANWVNSNEIKTNMRIENNKITFLSNHKRDLVLNISGSLVDDTRKSTIRIGVVKNGVTTSVYGSTAVYVPAPAVNQQFSTVIYLSGIALNDYLEFFLNSDNSGDVVTVTDLHWLVQSK